MDERNNSQFCKVDSQISGSDADRLAQDANARQTRRSVELCQNGVCTVTWKPSKTAVA